MHGKVIAASSADELAGWLQVINYDTDLPAHYTLSATFNFHDVKLNDQEQAAIRIIWNECVPVGLLAFSDISAPWGPCHDASSCYYGMPNCMQLTPAALQACQPCCDCCRVCRGRTLEADTQITKVTDGARRSPIRM